MNILVINGSPKGKHSVTLQTTLYLQACHSEHIFSIVHAAQLLRKFEQNFEPLRVMLKTADLILFCYPVYTFIAPYQLHRLMELIKGSSMSLNGKMASQITTSKHFYDMTAHRWVEENCFDFGMNVLKGLSADMDDLLTPQGAAGIGDVFPPAHILLRAQRLPLTASLPAAARTSALHSMSSRNRKKRQQRCRYRHKQCIR